MAKKYELITCRYDNRSKNKYQNEEVVKIPGTKLDTLEDIDTFTSRFPYFTFEKIMSNMYPDKNLYSIRVTDTKSGISYFLKTVYGDKELYKVLRMASKRTIDTLTGKRTVNMVPLGEKIVYQTFSPIREALMAKDYNKVCSLINTRKDYMSKMERFCNSSYDESAEDTNLFSLEKEFCDYPVFRDAYIPRIKKKVTNLTISPKKVTTFKNNISVDKEPKEAVVENLVLLNQGEKEEFLSEEEYQNSYGDSASYLGEGKKWKI